MTALSSRRRVWRWLAIPAFLVVLGLVGMAVATEPKEDFQQRAQDRTGTGPQDDAGQEQGRAAETGRSRERTDRPAPAPDGDTASGSTVGQADEQAARRPIVIRTGNGDFVVEVGQNGEPVRVVPGDSAVPVDGDRVIAPQPGGRFVGFRVTDDGRIEPVELADFGEGDYRSSPVPGGGVDIIRPDGTRLRLTPTEAGALTGAELGPGLDAADPSAVGGKVVVATGDELRPGIVVDPLAEPLLIQTDAGPVRIELERNGDLVANQPRTDDAVTIEAGEASAVRIGDDGALELVPIDQIAPGDTVLVPADGGFDLVRPDGSRVEFRADGEHDGITATEVSPDGEQTELSPNPDGSVTLPDGTVFGPIDMAEDGGTIEQLLDRTSRLPWPWVFGAIAALAALSIGTAVYLHRHRPDEPFDYRRLEIGAVPADRFEEFMAVLRADPDPARAIRLAFHAAERGLAGLPTRRVDETPFEWQSRVAQRRPDLAKPLAPICDLFARARFASGHATTGDRDLMVEHLRELNHVADRAAATPDLAGV